MAKQRLGHFRDNVRLICLCKVKIKHSVIHLKKISNSIFHYVGVWLDFKTLCKAIFRTFGECTHNKEGDQICLQKHTKYKYI